MFGDIPNAQTHDMHTRSMLCRDCVQHSTPKERANPHEQRVWHSLRHWTLRGESGLWLLWAFWIFLELGPRFGKVHFGSKRTVAYETAALVRQVL